MHANSALMLSNSFAIKSFDFENRVESIAKSVQLQVLAAPFAVHGGHVTKTKAKKPLKSKSADVLPVVADG